MLFGDASYWRCNGRIHVLWCLLLLYGSSCFYLFSCWYLFSLWFCSVYITPFLCFTLPINISGGIFFNTAFLFRGFFAISLLGSYRQHHHTFLIIVISSLPPFLGFHGYLHTRTYRRDTFVYISFLLSLCYYFASHAYHLGFILPATLTYDSCTLILPLILRIASDYWFLPYFSFTMLFDFHHVTHLVLPLLTIFPVLSSCYSS